MKAGRRIPQAGNGVQARLRRIPRAEPNSLAAAESRARLVASRWNSRLRLTSKRVIRSLSVVAISDVSADYLGAVAFSRGPKADYRRLLREIEAVIGPMPLRDITALDSHLETKLASGVRAKHDPQAHRVLHELLRPRSWRSRCAGARMCAVARPCSPIRW
jgi:hypothetical protein